MKTIEKDVIETFDLQTHSVFITYLENELKARGYDLSDKTLQKQLDNWAMNNSDFMTARGSQGLLYEDLKKIDNEEGVGFIGLAEGLDENMNVIEKPNTPTNVVDDFKKIATLDYPNQWHNTPTVKLVEAIAENNLDIYIKKTNGEFVKLGLDDTAKIGKNVIQNSPMFDKGKLAVYNSIRTVGFGDNRKFELDFYSRNTDELIKLQEALIDVNFDPLVYPEGTPFQLLPDTPGGSLGAAKLNDPLVFDSWVDNLGRTTASFVDNLPLETVVKNRIKNLIATKSKQLSKPGRLVVKAVDAWEFGVIGLMAAGIAFNEIDEVPTIINNTAINMFNSMTAPYGIAPVEKEEYDIDYEFINTVLDTGTKVMPTDIIIEKLKPYSLEEGEDVILPGTGVTATTGAKQQFEPYGEELAKRAEKTVNMKRDEVKQKILESKGVQEEKMFEQAKPKKRKPTGSAGAKIL